VAEQIANKVLEMKTRRDSRLSHQAYSRYLAERHLDGYAAVNVNEFRRIAPGLLTAERFASRVPLEYRQGLQTLPWERFQGRLVATRQMRTLESWSVFTDDREVIS
jgi:hypothetical protein